MTAFTAVANTFQMGVEKSSEGKSMLWAWMLTALLAIAVVMVLVSVFTMELTMMIPAGIIASVASFGLSMWYLFK